MRRPDPLSTSMLVAYRECGRRVRLHTMLRWWLCPFPAVEALLPESGRILDYGCGHGQFAMYLALRSTTRRIVGVDIDAQKIGFGTRVQTRAGLGGRVELLQVADDWLPEPDSLDAVVITDALYLLGHEHAGKVLDAAAEALRPGGVVVVKELDARPRWKAAINHVEERLAINVLHLTDGRTFEMLETNAIESRLAAHRLDVARFDLGRGYLHAHVAVVARKATA